MSRSLLATRRGALGLVAGAVPAIAGCGGRSETAERAPASRENVLGDPNAPVTVIEYASVTCAFCKLFHDETFPLLKARYIEPGHVRFIFRELPTEPSRLCMAGFLLARCAGEEKYFDVLDTLFDRQVPLIQAYRTGDARAELVRIAAAAGVDEQRFDGCVRDDAEIARIVEVGEDGRREYALTVTPTFVIDGKKHEGAMPIERFAAIIDPLLAARG